MKQYDASNLLIRAGNSKGAPPCATQTLVEVTPALAGWDTLYFRAVRLPPGGQWSFETGAHELVLVTLCGVIDVDSERGAWAGIGGRSSVFAGPPYALYLPVETRFTVTSRAGAEFAAAWTAADQAFPPRLATPADVAVELRGGENATRQINSLLPPGFPCQRLVVVEVYTPGGNWSSYPPHKHDVQRLAPDGGLLEADLDEIYYYRMDRPEGYAFQRVYTDPDSPLARAGLPFDVTLTPRDNDVVLVPEGYHPVACPPGYTAYYLNILAGSAQSLAGSDDPQYAWVKDTYRVKDRRVPLY